MVKSSTSKVAARIRKLAQIAEELRDGADFSITRLTTVKGLCKDPEAAARFVLHLAALTVERMERQDCPTHIEPATWSHFKALAESAVRQTRGFLEERTDEGLDALRALLSEIEGTQNDYKYLEWGPVRMIKSQELLLVEYALRCILSSDSPYWGYRVAREYAERYEPRYGTGLIPTSAPMVKEIADFWCRYHFGDPIGEWLASNAS